jgi:hypothetical protein
VEDIRRIFIFGLANIIISYHCKAVTLLYQVNSWLSPNKSCSFDNIWGFKDATIVGLILQ